MGAREEGGFPTSSVRSRKTKNGLDGRQRPSFHHHPRPSEFQLATVRSAEQSKDLGLSIIHQTLELSHLVKDPSQAQRLSASAHKQPGDITGSSLSLPLTASQLPALLILPAPCQLGPLPFWAHSRVQDHILPHLTLLFTFSTLDHPAGFILKHHGDVTLLLKAITHPHHQAAESKFVLPIGLPWWLR